MSLTSDVVAEVDRLREKAAEFSGVFDRFLAIRGYTVKNAALAAEWEKAYKYANTVKSAITWINNAVDSAYNTARDIFGMSGLGVLPAIPALTVAYVSASIAAIVFAVDWMLKIIYDAENEAKKIDLVADGKASDKILYTDADSLVSFGGATDSVKWLLIGAAALYFLPKLLGGRK